MTYVNRADMRGNLACHLAEPFRHLCSSGDGLSGIIGLFTSASHKSLCKHKNMMSPVCRWSCPVHRCWMSCPAGCHLAIRLRCCRPARPHCCRLKVGGHPVSCPRCFHLEVWGHCFHLKVEGHPVSCPRCFHLKVRGHPASCPRCCRLKVEGHPVNCPHCYHLQKTCGHQV